MDIRSRIRLLPAGLALLLSSCSAPPATMELVTVAQKALRDAQSLEQDRHQESLARLGELESAMDAAFDADARLVEAGRIPGSDGQPLPLSAEWVISARKGYAAGRWALALQRSRNEQQHATHLDNLVAADEALGLAGQLILQQYALSESARQVILAAQRRFIRE